MDNNNFPMHVGIVVTSAAQLASVYALLGGVAAAAIAVTRPAPIAQPGAEPAPTAAAGEGAKPAPDGGEPEATGDIDAGGHPWSAELHASTKGKTKDGFWRMRVGVSRPAPLPGFPKGEAGASTGATGTAASGAEAPAGAAATNQGVGPAAGEDEDEFAAFRAAADKVGATDAAAAAAIPPRKWTDADLGALCNQAAVKLGDPAPIKAIIAQHVPEGQVPHSRNIPEAGREAFAKAVEAAAGITFAG